jgi:two-component system, OmpR family, osmolarity sensor histidine kinase EnvZ
MRHAFTSIFGRLILAQILVIAVSFGAFSVLVGQQRGIAVARAVAPVWADATRQALGLTDKRDARPTREKAVVQSAEPVPASDSKLNLRYQVLQQELADLGIPVREVRVQRERNEETIWLGVASSGDRLAWVGFVGGILGERDVAPRWPLLALVLALILAVTALLTWTIVRPLLRLQQSIERYGSRGDWAPHSDHARPSGPLAVTLLEQTFDRMAQERTQLEHDRNLMLASVSHDLRSPLARIRLHADLLPTGDANSAEIRSAIQRNVDLADRHLAKFLDFAAPNTAEAASLVDAQSSIEQAAELALTDRQQLSVSVDASVATVYAQQRLLVRVLAIGLENAQKHGASPFRCSARAERNAVVFEVSDHGPGIALQDRARVLRPFERGENSRTTPGTGLGLALAQQMAQRMGGSLELDQQAHGLIFRLNLPNETTSRPALHPI